MLYVQTQNIWMKMRDVFYTNGFLYDVLRTNWSVEFFWFPFNSIKKCEALEAFVQSDVDIDDWDPKVLVVKLKHMKIIQYF